MIKRCGHERLDRRILEIRTMTTSPAGGEARPPFVQTIDAALMSVKLNPMSRRPATDRFSTIKIKG
jgi:hypothetical protein